MNIGMLCIIAACSVVSVVSSNFHPLAARHKLVPTAYTEGPPAHTLARIVYHLTRNYCVHISENH